MKRIFLFTFILASFSSCSYIQEKALEGRWECLEVKIKNWSEFENAYLEFQKRSITEVMVQQQLYLTMDDAQLKKTYDEAMQASRSMVLVIKEEFESVYKNRVINLNSGNNAVITQNDKQTVVTWRVSRKSDIVFIGDESFGYDSENFDRMHNTKTIAVADQVGEEVAAVWAELGLSELMNIKLEIKVIMELR
jgi:hypothetical protein